MDFLQELGKEGIEVSDARPCFLGTVGGEWAPTWADGYRSRILLASLTVENQSPGCQLSQRCGTSKNREDCLEPN